MKRSIAPSPFPMPPPFRRLAFPLVCFLALSEAVFGGIISFSAKPPAFQPGQEVTLTWSVTPGDVISISPGVGTVSGATGSVTVQPTAQTTYTLNDATSGTNSQVTVVPIAAPTTRNRWSFNEASGTTVADSISAQGGIV